METGPRCLTRAFLFFTRGDPAKVERGSVSRSTPPLQLKPLRGIDPRSVFEHEYFTEVSKEAESPFENGNLRRSFPGKLEKLPREESL
jgi:hypothetical protein